MLRDKVGSFFGHSTLLSLLILLILLLLLLLLPVLISIGISDECNYGGHVSKYNCQASRKAPWHAATFIAMTSTSAMAQ